MPEPASQSLTSANFPQLLVSVRDLHEARIADAGGVGLIDLKEPLRGSLGMVDLSTASQIAEHLPHATLSLALGELEEWTNSRQLPNIPKPFRYLKLGLSNEALHSDWQSRWYALRENIEERSESSFEWIAVVYVDRLEAKSPSAKEIIEAAVVTGCAGVLFDTYRKDKGSLLDLWSLDQLHDCREMIGTQGLLTAFAGSLQIRDLGALLTLEPEILAVRGAVCDASIRTGSISQPRIDNFHAAIRRQAVSHS